jgi:hypothetical protein
MYTANIPLILAELLAVQSTFLEYSAAIHTATTLASIIKL